ncbi:hypothetical protein [Burkholderia guangdongensis]|uniref:hypothetical protein n=1 Tax=Burkholderia guangdongensis TaxID=1792500 RepID=UPI0015CB6CB5|nr:hypothetical protein [Burkholderia guangdongensis]
MKKTISTYGPLAIILALAAAAYFHAAAGASSRGPLAAPQASAELARTVSFGLVGDVAQPMPDASPRVVAVAPKAL